MCEVKGGSGKGKERMRRRERDGRRMRRWWESSGKRGKDGGRWILSSGYRVLSY